MMPAKDARGTAAVSRDLVQNAFVLMAMAVVTLALGVGLYLQLGLAFWLAVIASLSLYVTALFAHVLLRRSAHLDELRLEVGRLKGELDRFRPAAPAEPGAALASTIARGPSGAAAWPRPDTRPGPAHTSEPASPAPAPAAERPQQAPSPAPARNRDSAQPQRVPPVEARVGTDAPAGRPRAPETAPRAPAPPTPRQDTAWDFRPSQMVARTGPQLAAAAVAPQPAPAPASVSPAPSAPAHMPPPLPRPAAPAVAARPGADIITNLSSASVIASYSPADHPAPKVPRGPPVLPATPPSAPSDSADEIQGLIRRLARDLNAPPAAETASEPSAPLEPVAAPQPQDIEASVAALRETAGRMRDSEPPRPAATIERSAPSAPVAASPGMAEPSVQTAPSPPAASVPQPSAKLDDVAAALERESIDVLLVPIMGLDDKKARHFEISLTVRLGSGEVVSARDIAAASRGSGLLPRLDALRVDRTTRVARYLESRGRTGSLFSALTAESLGSDTFLNNLADLYRDNERVASRLLLSFAQQDARTLSAVHCATLRDMADLGYRFALEDVTDLDMDFAAMKSSGFEFVKLDAMVFLEGLPTANGFVPAADLCRHLSGLGFGLIVGRIEDERQLAEIVGFGAVLGQGLLFGAPRPVKAEVLGQSAAAA